MGNDYVLKNSTMLFGEKGRIRRSEKNDNEKDECYVCCGTTGSECDLCVRRHK